MPVSYPRADFDTRTRARGWIFLPIPAPVGSSIHEYPRPWAKLPSLRRSCSRDTLERVQFDIAVAKARAG
jgi:hypothetical protein